MIQNAVTVKALFDKVIHLLLCIILLGEHFHAGQIFAPDYSLTDSDVLAECPTDCRSVVSSTDHCNWSCPVWWVGLLCIMGSTIL